jgi:Big-like domain-containing protein
MERPGTRRFVSLLLAGACLAAESTPSVAADPPPGKQLPQVAPDEPIVVRFRAPVRPSRVGSATFAVVRDAPSEAVFGRYVAGTFSRDPQTGAAAVVDPEAWIEIAQLAHDLDRAEAEVSVERVLARLAKSGKPVDLAALREDVAAAFPADPPFDPDLQADGSGMRTVAQQEETAPASLRALRRMQSGDDALWESFLVNSDLSAFETLSTDANAARFHHSIDPHTGSPFAQSDFQRRERRRVLLTGARSRRLYTFVPVIPQRADLSDMSLPPGETDHVRFSPGVPRVAALTTLGGTLLPVANRTAPFETSPAGTSPLFALSEMGSSPLRMVDVTPPDGERMVDPGTDWEGPDNRFVVPQPQRPAFVVRIRFNEPLDPRTVDSASCRLTQIRAGIGTADERSVAVAQPTTVRVVQSRLGEVRIEMTATLRPDPSSQYEVVVGDQVRALNGRALGGELVTRFTTAPLTSELDTFYDSFHDLSRWTEADTASPRTLTVADAAHDPEGLGLFVPFLGRDPVPVGAIQSQWIDSRESSPRYRVRFDDPATPVVEGIAFHEPAGSSVRLFGRTAPASGAGDGPDLALAGPWTAIDREHPALLGSRFLQLRLEFTVPADATPDTADLPFVERLSVQALLP